MSQKHPDFSVLAARIAISNLTPGTQFRACFGFRVGVQGVGLGSRVYGLEVRVYSLEFRFTILGLFRGIWILVLQEVCLELPHYITPQLGSYGLGIGK